jgi:hypothetical protein
MLINGLKGKKRMKQIGWFRALGLAAITLTAGHTLAAQAGSSNDPVLARLKAQFPVTVFSPDASQVVTAGAVVTLQKDGFLVFLLPVAAHPVSAYKNGRLSQGFGDTFTTCLANGIGRPDGCNGIPQKILATGEKFWISAIVVGKKDIVLVAVTDPYDDGRYIGELKFPFGKGQIPTPDEAVRMVSEVLTPEPPQGQPAQDQGSQQPAAPQSAPFMNPAQGGQEPPIAGQYSLPAGPHLLLLPNGSFTKFVGGGQGQGQYAVDGDNLTLTFTSTGFAQHFKIQGGNLVDVNTQQSWARSGDAPEAPPAPLPDIAPPPPPADAPPPVPPTIAIGQTMDQVSTAFGAPLKVARLGAKVIFYYKDMKVTFTNGKVTDVE